MLFFWYILIAKPSPHGPGGPGGHGGPGGPHGGPGGHGGPHGHSPHGHGGPHGHSPHGHGGPPPKKSITISFYKHNRWMLYCHVVLYRKSFSLL